MIESRKCIGQVFTNLQGSFRSSRRQASATTITNVVVSYMRHYGNPFRQSTHRLLPGLDSKLAAPPQRPIKKHTDIDEFPRGDPLMRALRWEEALRAWRIVQPTMFRRIYRTAEDR